MLTLSTLSRMKAKSSVASPSCTAASVDYLHVYTPRRLNTRGVVAFPWCTRASFDHLKPLHPLDDPRHSVCRQALIIYTF